MYSCQELAILKYIRSWDAGTTLTKKDHYPVAAGEARGGFSGHAIADSIVITGTGTAPRFMNVLDGTLGTQLASLMLLQVT